MSYVTFLWFFVRQFQEQTKKLPRSFPGQPVKPIFPVCGNYLIRPFSLSCLSMAALASFRSLKEPDA